MRATPSFDGLVDQPQGGQADQSPPLVEKQALNRQIEQSRHLISILWGPNIRSWALIRGNAARTKHHIMLLGSPFHRSRHPLPELSRTLQIGEAVVFDDVVRVIIDERHQ